MRDDGLRSRAAQVAALAGLVLATATSGVLLQGSTVVNVPAAENAVAAATVASGAGEPRAGDGESSGTSRSGISLEVTATPSNPRPTSEPPTAPYRTPTSRPAPSMPEIEPAPATRVSIPAIGVDAAVVPVDSTPTGKTNAWGGPIYAAIDFPVDAMVRQWVRRGSPNSLPADASAGRAAAFDRVVLYGHASDIGRRLTFQDLSSMRIGETVTVTTRLGRFTYQVFNVITGAKATLNNLPELYGYPSGGAKELALVACLPDTTSNVVVLAQLIGAAPVR